jgi:hypothetical protein
MPSTVPTVKAGLRDWLRLQPGLTAADEVTVRGAPVDPAEILKNLVVLTNVTAPQDAPVMVMSPDLREESATLTGYCVCTRTGNDDAAEDAARDAAYALFAIVEQALEADPSAGGIIPGPQKGLLTESGLTESPLDDNGSPGRQASVRWLLTWTSDF